jgi:hypothetical protein
VSCWPYCTVDLLHFQENSKDKLPGSTSPLSVPLPGGAPPVSPRPASAPAAGSTPPTPLSPKKKKGHLELNSIIAALTPKNRRKEESSGSLQEAPPTRSPRPASTRLARSRSTDRSSPFLRRRNEKEGISPSGSTGALVPAATGSGGNTPRRPPALEGELLVERLVHEYKVCAALLFFALLLIVVLGARNHSVGRMNF